MERNAEVLGLIGFTISGLLFVVSALRSGDTFAFAGSVVWILSCLWWIASTVRKHSRRSRKHAALGAPDSQSGAD
ncbi:MAG: hypothetical protein ACLFO1_06260 [Spirochaetaceae bacterium]